MATVLIIEDDPQMARMLGALVEFEGYRAVLCPAPERALDCVRETRPDVVVMDFHTARCCARPPSGRWIAFGRRDPMWW